MATEILTAAKFVGGGAASSHARNVLPAHIIVAGDIAIEIY